MTARLAAFVLTALALATSLPVTAGTASFGAGVKTVTVTSLAKLAADPDAFKDQVVRIEGIVLDVCPKKGCWMEVGAEGQSVKVKVEDDVIVFPTAAKGKKAVAEGKVEIRELTREAYTGWLAHLAEERGEKFDPATVGDGPYRIVQIAGTGAEIEGL
jgi:Domain of unknown function (DUF4920)